jgi:NAD(P)-dependent dehydrogenase (short-subunit alcohol dehydrogenase family)
MGVLDGRVAIVTGAGAGLGRGIAGELAKEGAAVAVAELDTDAAASAAAELAGLGVESRAYPTDVSDGAQVDATFDAVASDFGQLDIVVNNAGISRVGPHTQDVTDEDWHDSIAVMQTGVFYCMRAAARHMLPRKSGSVVNISSIRGSPQASGRRTACA